jgi:hypothetical protein
MPALCLVNKLPHPRQVIEALVEDALNDGS